MIRKIIKIDEEKCNGCGACAKACHEGAIEMINGVAKLTKENYCDGLGDCLPACPMDAISFEEREAPAYDEAAVLASKRVVRKKPSFTFKPSTINIKPKNNWPIQIKLAPIDAPYYENANVLIASDCSGFIYPAFQQSFMKNHVTLIGCPKLDGTDYSEKLSEIFKSNIKSITITCMEVPCCSGLEKMVNKAVSLSGKNIPIEKVVISLDGNII